MHTTSGPYSASFSVSTDHLLTHQTVATVSAIYYLPPPSTTGFVWPVFDPELSPHHLEQYLAHTRYMPLPFTTPSSGKHPSSLVRVEEGQSRGDMQGTQDPRSLARPHLLLGHSPVISSTARLPSDTAGTLQSGLLLLCSVRASSLQTFRILYSLFC